jgi:hypothetical protein
MSSLKRTSSESNFDAKSKRTRLQDGKTSLPVEEIAKRMDFITIRTYREEDDCQYDDVVKEIDAQDFWNMGKKNKTSVLNQVKDFIVSQYIKKLEVCAANVCEETQSEAKVYDSNGGLKQKYRNLKNIARAIHKVEDMDLIDEPLCMTIEIFDSFNCRISRWTEKCLLQSKNDFYVFVKSLYDAAECEYKDE